MSILTVTNDFVPNTTIQSSQVNQNFTDVEDVINTYTISEGSGLHGGKISVTIASNNLTVAIKTLDGDDPSVANPVHVMIGGVVRSITSALSFTMNASTTNVFDIGTISGGQLVNMFVYAGYNATDGVTLGIARIPGARKYSDFSATSTNPKYAKISTISNASANDSYINIGRFSVTLTFSSPNYNWSGVTDIIQHQILFSDKMEGVPTITYSGGGGTAPGSPDFNYMQYDIIGNKVTINHWWFITTTNSGTSITTASVPVPFTADGISLYRAYVMGNNNQAGTETARSIRIFDGESALTASLAIAGSQSFGFSYQITYYI